MKQIPYYRVKNGRAFFELGREKADRVGMQSSYPLGKDGIATKRAATELYFEWQELSGKPTPNTPTEKYIRGSLAHWYSKFKQTERWADKAVATTREWDYVWSRYLEAAFGNRRIDKITPMEFDRFWSQVERDHGENIRWRTIKIARALFNAAVQFDVIDKSPCNTRINKMPKARSHFWYEHEILQLIQTAETNAYSAMALGIRIAWETLMSPGDVRVLPIGSLKSDGEGFYIETRRKKTGRDVYAAICDDLAKDIIAYIDGLPPNQLPSSPILRTSRDMVAYRRVRFTDEFARIRRMTFGGNERRQMRDVRRSGNIEADLGGATPEDRAAILANTLHKDMGLETTYTPPTVAKARKLAKNRETGRAILRQQSRNVMPYRVGMKGK